MKVLRFIGKLIAGAAITATTTYIGNKFLMWAGVLEARYQPRRKT